jgi:ubiquinone biosynthesis accessory factor UbiJ
MNTLNKTALSILESAMNNYLKLDPELLPQLKALEGKILAVLIKELNITLYFSPSADGICVQDNIHGEPDAILSGSIFNLLRLGITRGNDANRKLFANDIHVKGDTEFGFEFKRIIDNMEIDWEEHLSRITGDVIAHNLGEFARGIRDTGTQIKASMQRNVSEFIQEEARLSPPREEVEDFYSDIATLRDDVDRLEARLQRLHQDNP